MSGAATRINARAQDRASDDDRAWFQRNPGRLHRIRRPVPGEVPLDPDHLTFVAVRAIRPGVRMRLTFLADPQPEAEAPEAVAAAVFAGLVAADEDAAHALHVALATGEARNA